MAEGKTVYDQLEEILANQKQTNEKLKQEHEEIKERLDHLESNQAARGVASGGRDNATANNRRLSKGEEKSILQGFFKKAIQEYIWLGSDDDYNKEKKRITIFALIAICGMIMCTVISSIAFGIYSTFTFFENIWLFMSFFGLKYIVVAKKRQLSWTLALNCFENYRVDEYGIVRFTDYKKKYKVFYVIASICFALNAVCAWIVECSVPLLVTILEICIMGWNIFTVHKVADFFDSYGPIKFTGRTLDGSSTAIIYFDPIDKEYLSENDYLKKYPPIKSML